MFCFSKSKIRAVARDLTPPTPQSTLSLVVAITDPHTGKTV